MQRILGLLCIGALSLSVAAQSPGPVVSNVQPPKVLLPNGWSLTPAGHSLPLGDLPLNIAVSSSRRYLAVTNNGQSTQTIQLIDAEKEQVLDSVIIPKSWLGLTFSADEKYLYASGGNDNRILKYAVNPGADGVQGGARPCARYWWTAFRSGRNGPKRSRRQASPLTTAAGSCTS